MNQKNFHGFILLSIVFFSNLAFANEKPKEKEWTFLVFMNGHNNLSYYADENVRQMEETGSSDQVNILVELGTSSPISRRFYIEKSNDPSKITSPILKEMPNYDMGDYKNLIEFIDWGVKNYPAKHYFIVVWSHGTGWHRKKVDKHISLDDFSNNSITTPQLALALQKAAQLIGRKVDIYGSDACLMQMIEVATELNGSVDYVVGSQENIPGTGWPYSPFMKKWIEKPKLSPQELSTLLVDEYGQAYNGGVYYNNSSTTLSALDLSVLPQLNASIKNLKNELLKLSPSPRGQVMYAFENALSFNYSDYVDLGDFLVNLQKTTVEDIKPTVAKVQENLQKFVIAKKNGSQTERAFGVSIWLTTEKAAWIESYKELIFSAETQWDEFIQSLSAP